MAKSRKSPMLLLSTFMIWAILLYYFAPTLLRTIFTSQDLVEYIFLVLFSCIQLFFWLLASYYLSIVLFYLLLEFFKAPSSSVENCNQNPVAIFYLTCNDFRPDAAKSCIDQNYLNYHLFLLDDSTRREVKYSVDAFHADYPDKTTIIRRNTRKGFKSGALNNALKGIAADFPFFAVVDADEILPVDFLKRIMALLCDSNFAFVQANHVPTLQQKTSFARGLCNTILPFWEIYCSVRNKYGFVTYLGHGAVIRRSAWEDVGGFPENVLTEDLAFSLLTREKGWQGLFLQDLTCKEDFPKTYPAFKRQYERFIIGTTQVIYCHLEKVLKNRSISLTEKFDILFWCAPLYIPALLLIYIILCSVFLALFFGEFNAVYLSIWDNQIFLVPIITLDERFNSLMSNEFQLLAIFVTFAPTFASLVLGLRGQLKALELISLSTVPYHSLMVLSWRALLKCALNRDHDWIPTGDKNNSINFDRIYGGRTSAFSKSSLSNFAAFFTSNFWDISFGIGLTLASLLSLNITFFAVSCCLLWGIYIEKYGWEKWQAKIGSYFSFSLIIVAMVFNISIKTGIGAGVPLSFAVHL